MSGFKHIEFKISLLSYGCHEGGQSFFKWERGSCLLHDIRSSLYGYGGGEFVSSGDEVFYASKQGYVSLVGGMKASYALVYSVIWWLTLATFGVCMKGKILALCV